MRRWIVLGAAGGLVGGLLSATLTAVLEGSFQPTRIGMEGALSGVSLALAAAAAYGPSGWVGRGLAGGVTFGVVRGGLTVALSLTGEPWPTVMGGEVVGGLAGGLLLAYLWRPGPTEAGGGRRPESGTGA